MPMPTPSSKYRIQKTFLERHPRLIRQATLVATFCGSFAFGGAVFSWTFVCRAGQCPSVKDLATYKPRQTSKLYSADGKFITEIGLERRTLLPLAEIPPMLRDAFLIVEDRRFYSHHGIDWWTIPGAMVANIRHGEAAQGGSTITQQLARKTYFNDQKTIRRKLKEMVVALRIEMKYDKPQILEFYLNKVYFGEGLYGVEAASRGYFNKSAKELTLPEAATLAGLIKAPSRYAPTDFKSRAIGRRATVLARMVDAGFIDKTAADTAAKSPLEVVNGFSQRTCLPACSASRDIEEC